MKDSDEFDPDWRLIAIGVEQADEACITLNNLIRKGIISKDKIFYKHLKNTVEFLCNPLHKYDEVVKEFYSSIAYLGGARTYNFLRGPMGIGVGSHLGKSNSLQSSKYNMNFWGPSPETLRKMQGAYTCKSGVIKHLSLLHYKLFRANVRHKLNL